MVFLKVSRDYTRTRRKGRLQTRTIANWCVNAPYEIIIVRNKNWAWGVSIAEWQRSASSLSDLKNRSENLAGRGQILPVLQVNSYSIDQKSGEIWTGQANLQPISFKSDRLLAGC